MVPLLFFSWQNPFAPLSAVQQPWEVVSSHTSHPVLNWPPTPNGHELIPTHGLFFSVLLLLSLSNSALYFLPFAFLFVFIFVQWHGLKYIGTCPSRADSNATSPRKPALLSPISYKKSSLLIGTVCKLVSKEGPPSEPRVPVVTPLCAPFLFETGLILGLAWN